MRYPLLLACLAIAVPASMSLAQDAPPKTQARAVEDTFHGVKVSDPYRWLEDWNSPDVKNWSESQNDYARSVLDNLPDVEAIRERVTQVLSASSVSYGSPAFHGGKMFAVKRQPPKQQPFLVVMDSPHHPDTARVLVDPNTMNSEGTTAIDWYEASPDGKLVAVSLSEGGSESGDLHVFDVETGKQVFEVIPHVQNGTAGGSVAWMPDSKGFFYTRYPRGDERPTADRDFYMQVYKHTLGEPTEKDTYEIGKDFPKIAEVVVECNDAGVALVNMQKGDGGEFQHYVRTLDGKWTQIDVYEDRVVQAEFGHDDEKNASTVLLVSRKNTPRGKLLKLTVDNNDHAKIGKLAGAEVLIPEGTDTLVSAFSEDTGNIATTKNALYLTYQVGGPSEVRVFDWSGKRLDGPTQYAVGAVAPIVAMHGTDDAVLFGSVSYINAPTWSVYQPGKTVRLPISQESPLDFTEFEVTREFATSKDGHTRVPINIIRKRGVKLDGNHPCMVTAYGGYGVNIAPSFRTANRVLLEQGVIIAEANIRGGGEYGEEWHHQGNLLNKQNVFDDFYAACQHMVKSGYTTPQRMVIQGGSNGGLLMGATLTQHPDVAKCVVSHVGIYDMLRVELSPNGAFNIPEFGTVKDEKQFKALYAYSPYHHVRSGVDYPNVLFLTGANDPRVDPMQSRKMTAALQAVGAKVLLRTSANSGHGIGSSLGERIEQAVDIDAFIFDQLGVKFDPSRSK